MDTVKAIFVDSDGVINKAIINQDGKPVAPTSLKELTIPHEVKPALERLKKAGYLLICVTNKPDVERGLMTQKAVDQILNYLQKKLPLDDMFVCYSEQSDCYKPKPGLLFSAAQKYPIDLTKSFMIGDRWRDIGAGKGAGCKTVWIDRKYPNDPPPAFPDYTAQSLKEAVNWILEHPI